MKQFVIVPATTKKLPTVKLCRDCVHFKQLKCTKYVRLDLVYGTTRYPSCELVRYDPGFCGPGGKDFEKQLSSPSQTHPEFTSSFEEQDLQEF